MSIGNATVVRSTIPGVHKVQGVWTGGGANADCTLEDGDWSRGIAALAHYGTSGSGQYLLTFTDCGQQIVGSSIVVTRPTGSAVRGVLMVTDSFDPVAKTVLLEFDIGDLPVEDKVLVSVDFVSFAP